jgi:hypothetical protein
MPVISATSTEKAKTMGMRPRTAAVWVAEKSIAAMT